MYLYSNQDGQHQSQAFVACNVFLGEVHITVLYCGVQQFAMPLEDVKTPQSIKEYMHSLIDQQFEFLINPPDKVWFYNEHESDVPPYVTHAYRQLCAAIGPAQSIQTAFLLTQDELMRDAYAGGNLVALQEETRWEDFISVEFASRLQEIIDEGVLFNSNITMYALKTYLVHRANSLECYANPIGPMPKVYAMMDVVSILDFLNVFRQQ